MKVWEIIGTDVKEGVDVRILETPLSWKNIPAVVLQGNEETINVPVVSGSEGRIIYATYRDKMICPTNKNTERGVLVTIRHIKDCSLRVCCVNFVPQSEPHPLDTATFVVKHPCFLIAGMGRSEISEVMFGYIGKKPITVYTFWTPKRGENFWLLYEITEERVEICRGSFLTALYRVPKNLIPVI